jgi:hypothetical protein
VEGVRGILPQLPRAVYGIGKKAENQNPEQELKKAAAKLFTNKRHDKSILQFYQDYEHQELGKSSL